MDDIPFRFVVDPGKFLTDGAFALRVPTGIDSRSGLLLHYLEEGRFPSYFGRNWDALTDCLRDFGWIEERRIVIVHTDLPLRADEEALRIYLEILEQIVEEWRMLCNEDDSTTMYAEHDVDVVFPMEVEPVVVRLLRGGSR